MTRPTIALLKASFPQMASQTHLENYFDWLDFGNPSSPYSKHTVKAYKNEILLFLQFCFNNGVEELSEVGNPLIRQYLATYAKNNAKQATITQKLSCIDSYFEWLYLEGFLDTNSVSKYKQSLRRGGRGGRKEVRIPSFLTLAEAQKIFLFLNRTDTPTALKKRAIIGLLLDTGMRVSEIGAITLQDINELLSIGYIKVIGKGNKERIIHARGQYLDVVSNYFDYQREQGKNSSDLFFSTTFGNPIKQENLFSLINGILKKLDIKKPQTGAHLLRHTAATMMLQEGRSIKEVQQSLGHSSIQTTSLYTHVVEGRLNGLG